MSEPEIVDFVKYKLSRLLLVEGKDDIHFAYGLMDHRHIWLCATKYLFMPQVAKTTISISCWHCCYLTNS